MVNATRYSRATNGRIFGNDHLVRIATDAATQAIGRQDEQDLQDVF